MQLGLGFCVVGYSTRVRVGVSLQGLGFESGKKMQLELGFYFVG